MVTGTNGRCYGPAFIRAYQIESEDANYPRVLVDDNVICEALNNPYNRRDDEAEYLYSLIEKDFDGKTFIDFLKIPFDDIFEYFEMIKKTIQIAEDGIREYCKNSRVRKKYEWLESYVNRFRNS